MNRLQVAGSLAVALVAIALLVACGPTAPVGETTAVPMAGADVTSSPAPPTGVESAPEPPSPPRASPTAAQVAAPATPTTSPPATARRATDAPTSPPAEPVPTATQVASTATPPPSPTATGARPSPTTAPPAPQVLSFRVEPETARNVGDTLRISWRAVGESARLCPMTHGPVESRCQEVPLEGSREYVTTEESLAYAGFGLKVTAGDEFVWGTQTVHFLCENLRTWFFDDPPLRCPAAEPAETYAAGQYFERGLMIWREDTDLFYVLCEGDVATFNQRLYQVPPSSLAPGASPDNRVGEDPPPGLYEPVSGFGMVWRGELQSPERDFRECLGWATEPEAGFTLVEQCETAVLPGAWACYVRAPRGEIVRLAAATNAGYPLIWEEYRPAAP